MSNASLFRLPLCVKTGVQCLQSSQCCSLRDVCLTNAKYSIYAKHRYSTCENVEALAASRYVKPHKKAGEECRDSLECLDLCCREYRGHRYHLNRCGKSEDDFTSYTCVMAPPKTGNDVLDDEIGLK
ncbi:hypothetical protein LOTGIDRAFT_233317 [Lottia gigantea]|uniref:Uncharacterized protein n=1 Tax=Lottia gigantea TaxID=225164 RepID=V4A5S0_LOTGI|nr:hypothetical protein LOTGIDRAFT_233317 [Lottia gigantea]ESO92062.1 hypothetical protein LOTGIDRAFT_233317 [Lottia gigantea]